MKWDFIERGYLGEMLTEKLFIENGFNVFKPSLPNGKVDMIVEKDSKYFKLQIKLTRNSKSGFILPVFKVSHNMGTYKIFHYSETDIDYFVGADIENNDIYIVPSSVTSKYSRTVSISKILSYKNNFKQMELTNGNISNEHDDNVESLTDNADGNDVGIDLNQAARE